MAGTELLVEPSATLGRGPGTSFPTIITNKVHKWLPGETINSNTEKLVREFGRFLGFLELMPDGNYVTDPTRAIQYFLPEIFDDTHTLPAKIFMANMAEVMPMMDGASTETPFMT